MTTFTAAYFGAPPTRCLSLSDSLLPSLSLSFSLLLQTLSCHLPLGHSLSHIVVLIKCQTWENWRHIGFYLPELRLCELNMCRIRMWRVQHIAFTFPSPTHYLPLPFVTCPMAVGSSILFLCSASLELLLPLFAAAYLPFAFWLLAN